MKKIIDIHSHILPGVDDGCKTKKEAIEMLKLYEGQNVEAVICTPHFGPCGITGADVNGSFEWLRSTESSVNLFLGNEILFTSRALSDIRKGSARTLANSKWVLIEFEEWAYSSTEQEILEGTRWMEQSEFKPILAHAERYACIQNNPEICIKITESGVKLQINAYDIWQTENKDTARTAQYLLKNRLVSFLGSDAHGSTRRPPALTTGVRWIYDHCPVDYADEIVHDNAEKIIKEGGA